MATLPTYDYEVEGDRISRRRKLLDSMLSGGLAPLDLPQQRGVKVSPLAAIAKIMQVLVAQRGQAGVDTDQAALKERYNSDLTRGLPEFMAGVTASPTDLEQLPDTVQGPTNQIGPVNARKMKMEAILKAATANHPVMRELGMKMLPSMLPKEKEELSLKDALPHMSGASVTQALQTGRIPANATGKRNLGEAGGVVYDKDTGEVVQLSGGYKQGDIVRIPGADGKLEPYQVNPSTRKLEKMDQAPQTQVKIDNKVSPVIKGQNAGFEAWATSAVKTVSELSEKARAAVNMATSMNQLENLTQQGTNAGPLADAAVFLQGLAKQGGIKIDGSKLANSETFSSESTRVWAELMNSMGGARGLVKEESEKIARSIPALSQSPQGRAQIIALFRQAGQQAQADAVKANQELGDALQSQDPRRFTFGLSQTILPQSDPRGPAPGSSAPSGQPKPKSAEQWLKENGS